MKSGWIYVFCFSLTALLMAEESASVGIGIEAPVDPQVPDDMGEIEAEQGYDDTDDYDYDGDDGVVLWTGPGWYYGFWFDDEVDFNGWNNNRYYNGHRHSNYHGNNQGHHHYPQDGHVRGHGGHGGGAGGGHGGGGHH